MTSKNGYTDPKDVVADYGGIPQVQPHVLVSGDLGTYFSDGETEVSENHGPLPMAEWQRGDQTFGLLTLRFCSHHCYVEKQLLGE